MPETMNVLGLTFTKMTPRDYDGFAGAPSDAFMCDTGSSEDGRILIWSPSELTLTVIDDEGDEITLVQHAS